MIVWRDGEPVTLTRFGPDDDEEEFIDLHYHGPKWARESPYGIIICSIWPSVELLRIPTLTIQHLGRFQSVSLMNDGRYLAVGLAYDATIAIIDLADGSQLAETWRHPQLLGIIGNYDGYVYANSRAGTQQSSPLEDNDAYIYPNCRPDGDSRPVTWRWKPGQKAESLDLHISQIDSISGTYLIKRRTHTEVVTQAGRTFKTEPRIDFNLSPGGRSIYAIQDITHFPYGHDQSPSITFIDLGNHGTSINHKVPRNSELHHAVWEDTQHLLVPTWSDESRDESQPVHVHRMNVETGLLSLVSGCGAGPHRPLLIDPFIRN